MNYRSLGCFFKADISNIFPFPPDCNFVNLDLGSSVCLSKI